MSEVRVGNYLIHVESLPNGIRAAEWNRSKGWTVSEKEGASWHDSADPLGEMEHQAVLNHFGLTKWFTEYPLNKILKMSPAQLAQERRDKERKHNMEKLEMYRFGDTSRPAAKNFS